MTPELLASGFMQYVVFLLSTTCHEAAHALAAKMGGDMTAFEGGQVTLNPLPHIKREPFGMVLMPLLGIFTGSGLIGWASAPYDPLWSIRHPKRAGLMSLAGPAANFALAIAAGLALRIGMSTGVLSRGNLDGSLAEGIAAVLGTFFTLNLLLGVFNLLPFPPLDGYGALSLLTSEDGARKLMEWRFKFRGFAILGLVLGWRIVDQIYQPLLQLGINLIYPTSRL
ncbi:MAG: site-2 protease family protein [Acidobacteriia bacterium]|nr:site-2 protease family protein [Terriglobia bacterium]